jgi:hypothetical protein
MLDVELGPHSSVAHSGASWLAKRLQLPPALLWRGSACDGVIGGSNRRQVVGTAVRPSHHALEGYLDAYIDTARIREERKVRW